MIHFMRSIFCLLMVLGACMVHAQVITNFPSLLIHASSRGMGMGDAGIASAEGAQQLQYNPAKSAFTQYFHSLSVGYMPWLTGISNDTRMLNATYMGIAGNTTFGVNLNYLKLGSIETRDDNGATLASYDAREFNVGGSIAVRLNEHHSISTTLKFISQNSFAPNPVTISTVCGDIGYYGNVQLADASDKIEWGVTLSNLGPKKYNLPFSGGFGVAYIKQSDQSSFQFSFDVSQLINDGSKGLRYMVGAEYGYAEQFFMRAGASIESATSGNRKYFSLGAGYKGFVSDQSWNIDLHYLVPFGYGTGLSPFQNCWGLTLGINIGNFQ